MNFTPYTAIFNGRKVTVRGLSYDETRAQVAYAGEADSFAVDVADLGEAPEKRVEARVSISTDSRVEGKYFVDVRDVTGGANRQMTTRVTDTPADFIAELTTAALKAGVFVETVDNTGE